MIRYINNKQRVDMYQAMDMYKNCKVILSDLDMTDLENITGMTYAYSDDYKDFKKLCDMKNELNKDKPAMIVGSYNNGGAVGVQYEIE